LRKFVLISEIRVQAIAMVWLVQKSVFICVHPWLKLSSVNHPN
jgi:hypothetical protein